jgi:hypothetical protein
VGSIAVAAEEEQGGDKESNTRDAANCGSCDAAGTKFIATL